MVKKKAQRIVSLEDEQGVISYGLINLNFMKLFQVAQEYPLY